MGKKDEERIQKLINRLLKYRREKYLRVTVDSDYEFDLLDDVHKELVALYIEVASNEDKVTEVMTLDEAIKHCDYIAEGNERHVLYTPSETVEDIERKDISRKCAKEHRQLAEWLRELKAYKENTDGCEFCKYEFNDSDKSPCSICSHNFVDKFERRNGDNETN